MCYTTMTGFYTEHDIHVPQVEPGFNKTLWFAVEDRIQWHATEICRRTVTVVATRRLLEQKTDDDQGCNRAVGESSALSSVEWLRTIR